MPNSHQDILPNKMPISLVKDCRDPIWAWGLYPLFRTTSVSSRIETSLTRSAPRSFGTLFSYGIELGFACGILAHDVFQYGAGATSATSAL